MWKSLVGRISRWIRRASDKYCTIELDKDARGLARCLVHDPLTKKEKAKKYRQQLLRGVEDEDKDGVIDHFSKLSKENDPLENAEEILDNSVKKVNPNISVEDVQARIKGVSKEEYELDSRQKAENAIKGLRRWPVSPPHKTRRKS